MARPSERVLAARAVGLVGGAAGVGASLYVLFGPVVTVTSATADGTTTSGTRSGIDALLGSPDVGVALFVWPVLLGAMAVLGAAAAWQGRDRWTLASGLALAVFVLVGMLSIGLLYAPAAALLLVAAAVCREK